MPSVKNNSCLEILDTASVNKILLHNASQYTDFRGNTELKLRLPPGLFQREVLNVHHHSFSKHETQIYPTKKEGSQFETFAAHMNNDADDTIETSYGGFPKTVSPWAVLKRAVTRTVKSNTVDMIRVETPFHNLYERTSCRVENASH